YYSLSLTPPPPCSTLFPYTTLFRSTLGTWIGYETQASIWCDNCTYSYSQRNQKLWANLINETSEIDPELMAPKEKFEEPEDIVTRDYCAISGLAPSKLCSDIGLVYSDI